ncbi:MAG: DUF1080 domain-containing protein [Planctomycetes bacterium]|nr:DUF1080 domain-containing protein [Planctomycetota bacterium]
MNTIRLCALVALLPTANLDDVTIHDSDAGWHALFDGSTTDSWRGYKQDAFPDKGWVIEDGALVHREGGGGGDIITKRAYRNFELELEWKVAKGANSGVIYKVAETEPASYQTGLEYQILDDEAHEGASTQSIGSGGLYALYTPQNKQLFPVGSWNRAKIVVDGSHVEHWLNGARILEAELDSDDWKERVQKSKFAAWKRFGTVARGHIALQDHGNEVAFRNIRIRELAPTSSRQGEARVLFDGRSLDAWTCFLNDDGKLEDVWSIEDGILVCKGRPTGYLMSKDQFDNFILEVEWRWPEGKNPGNSGVLVRKTGEDKTWPRSIEAQLQSGQAGDFWNIGEFGMQTVDGRRKGRNTKKTHSNEKAIGGWNRYRITCDGPWVRLEVNGEVLNEAWGCESHPGNICLQSEGAEIHFRSVRLIPLEDA